MYSAEMIKNYNNFFGVDPVKPQPNEAMDIINQKYREIYSRVFGVDPWFSFGGDINPVIFPWDSDNPGGCIPGYKYQSPAEPMKMNLGVSIMRKYLESTVFKDLPFMFWSHDKSTRGTTVDYMNRCPDGDGEAFRVFHDAHGGAGCEVHENDSVVLEIYSSLCESGTDFFLFRTSRKRGTQLGDILPNDLVSPTGINIIKFFRGIPLEWFN